MDARAHAARLRRAQYAERAALKLVDAEAFCDRIRRATLGRFLVLDGTNRRSETRRIEGSFIRRRAEGAIKRSLTGAVTIHPVLHVGLELPFPSSFGDRDCFEYLHCDDKNIYLLSHVFHEEDGDDVEFSLPCQLPLIMIKRLVFYWEEERDSYTTEEIAALLGVPREEVEAMALREGWKYRERKIRRA